jgi:hypothetical protein
VKEQRCAERKTPGLLFSHGVSKRGKLCLRESFKTPWLVISIDFAYSKNRGSIFSLINPLIHVMA